MNGKHSCTCPAVGLLIIRLAVALVFIYSGVQKLMNMDATSAMFQGMGISAFWTWVAALTETIGGVAFLLGVHLQIFGTLLAITMFVAVIKTWGAGFGRSLYPIVLLLTSLGLGATGPGKFALKCHACMCKRGEMKKDGGCCGGGNCGNVDGCCKK